MKQTRTYDATPNRMPLAQRKEVTALAVRDATDNPDDEIVLRVKAAHVVKRRPPNLRVVVP